MGSVLAILKGVAQLIGLGDALERWLERNRAEAAGRAEQKADDDQASLKVAEDAQHTDAALAGADRAALIDSLSGAASDK